MSFDETMNDLDAPEADPAEDLPVEEATESREEEPEGDEAAETPEESKDSVPSNERPTLTDEELDQVADTALETLRSILAYFGAEEAAIDEYEGEEGELILDVIGEDLAVLIGRYGKTLDALQFLVASVVNKRIGFRYPIIVDIEGYRHRRRQKLESLAKSSAARCIRSKSDVRLRPMTPYERRLIHIILRSEQRVFTESEGEEPNRFVVVRLNER